MSSAPGSASAGPAGGQGGVAGAGRTGRLYVVSTPIGNLADVTLRALETLAAVPLVAAEDTRHTRRLLDRHGITARLISYHARSAPARLEELLRHLRGGQDLAVVADAGTPGISDPGEALVAAWSGEGGEVVPIPGASAVLAAVAATGLAGARWGFEGFLPRAGRERRERIARIAGDERGTVIYEAPGRMAGTLADLAVACGEARPGAVCRELTKLHESIVRGSLGALAVAAHQGAIPARGEVVLVVGAVMPHERAEVAGPDGRTLAAARRGRGSRTGHGGAPVPGVRPEDAGDPLVRAQAEVEALVAGGMARGAAARTVAASTGLPRRSLYGDRRPG